MTCSARKVGSRVDQTEPMGSTRSAARWPRWVYGTGTEPDYRFSFANERTFLAWLRTALALLAGGVALDAVDLSIPQIAREGLAIALLALGVACAVLSWVRWARAERAIRRKAPLPGFGFAIILAAGLLVIGTALLALFR